jgi:hypothetical protein
MALEFPEQGVIQTGRLRSFVDLPDITHSPLGVPTMSASRFPLAASETRKVWGGATPGCDMSQVFLIPSLDLTTAQWGLVKKHLERCALGHCWASVPSVCPSNPWETAESLMMSIRSAHSRQVQIPASFSPLLPCLPYLNQKSQKCVHNVNFGRPTLRLEGEELCLSQASKGLYWAAETS